MLKPCEICVTAACTHCDWRGYGSLLPGYEGGYLCPRCHRVGIETEPISGHQSPNARHYKRLSAQFTRHCRTCTCGTSKEGEQS